MTKKLLLNDFYGRRLGGSNEGHLLRFLGSLIAGSFYQHFFHS